LVTRVGAGLDTGFGTDATGASGVTGADVSAAGAASGNTPSDCSTAGVPGVVASTVLGVSAVLPRTTRYVPAAPAVIHAATRSPVAALLISMVLDLVPTAESKGYA
jgi:hypothetical protein